MAEVVYWLGEATQTSASVCVRVDTAGSYTVVCNGATTAPQALDPAVNYGVARFDVAGLAPDTRYPFEVRLAGTLEAAGTLRTDPTADQSFHIAFCSCMQMDADPALLRMAADEYDIRALFPLGDMPYTDVPIGTGGNSRFGLTSLPGSYTAPNDINTWHAQLLYLHRDLPSFAATVQRVQTLKSWGDHDALCNDFDHKLASANVDFPANGGLAFATQAALDAAFKLGATAFDIWSIGNPANTSPLIGPWKPANAAALDAQAHRPRCFSKRLGAALFHVLDGISCRAGQDDTDNGDLIENVATAKTLLGRPQLRWLKHSLLTSPTAFNPILSDKCTYVGAATSDNHGWSDCPTERDHTVDWIGRFARGVVFGTGDVHAPFVVTQERHAMINATPLGQAEHDGTSAVNLGTTYTQGVSWKAVGPMATTARGTPRCIGMVYVTPRYLDWFIVSDMGDELGRWRQYPNANTVQRIG